MYNILSIIQSLFHSGKITFYVVCSHLDSCHVMVIPPLISLHLLRNIYFRTFWTFNHYILASVGVRIIELLTGDHLYVVTKTHAREIMRKHWYCTNILLYAECTIY